jgi:hypothetical protein
VTSGERPRFLGRPVPASFDVRRLEIPPGSERPTEPREWRRALVVVEAGCVEVVCVGGARRTYPAGSLIGLTWLATERLVNAGPGAVRLLAISPPPRDGDHPTTGGIHR